MRVYHAARRQRRDGEGRSELSIAHPSSRQRELRRLVGCVLMIPAVLGAMSLVRERPPGSVCSRSASIAGYVPCLGLCLQSYATIAIWLERWRDKDHVTLLNATMNQPFVVPPSCSRRQHHRHLPARSRRIRARVVPRGPGSHPRLAGAPHRRWPWESRGRCSAGDGLRHGPQLVGSPQARAVRIPEEVPHVAPHRPRQTKPV
jgi:hypothetical protein